MEAVDIEISKPTEIDLSVAETLKAALQQESPSWSEIIDKWQKTVELRKSDVKLLKTTDLFLSWPNYYIKLI